MTQANNDKMLTGAVTLLDILGWKGIWQRKGDAIDSIKGIIEQTEKKVDLFTGETSKFKRFIELKTKVISISDTIAIVTEGDSDLTLEFHAGMSMLIMLDSLKKSLLIRGATCYGNYIVDSSIMIGPAIDEVASWYELVDWMGVVLTPSANFRAQLGKVSQKINMFIEYEVDTKGYGKYNTMCVNWPGWFLKEQKFGREDIINVFLNTGTITPDISKKFSNTLKFYDSCINKTE